MQAAINCLHGFAPSADDTDWPQIAELYRMLEAMLSTPVVRVNRAVAESEAHGAAAGMVLLDGLDATEVEQWHLYWSTRGELLHRSGDTAAAVSCFDRALSCQPNDSDRRFLERRRAELLGAL